MSFDVFLSLQNHRSLLPLILLYRLLGSSSANEANPEAHTFQTIDIPKMPLPNPDIYRKSSSSFSRLAQKTALHLRRNPEKLESLSSEFTPEAASYLLLKAQTNKHLTIDFVAWARNRRFFSLRCKCIALHVLTRFKLYKTAQTLAEDVAVDSGGDEGNSVFECLSETFHVCKSSSAVFDLVVKSYSHLKLTKKAINIVNLAKFRGYMPGVLSYNAILDSIIRSRGLLESAQKMFDEMLDSGVSPNVFTYNILIRGFCAAGNLQTALNLFSEMEKKWCSPNVVTFNTLIDGFCKSRRIEEAFGLFRSMAVKGLEPNLISYNVVINGLCQEGRVKDTARILEEMKRKGFLPDAITFNTLVNGSCKDGNLHQALAFHAEMLRNGLSPNVITYTALIHSMCKARNLNRATEFFEQMKVRGLRPNERTYTTLIDGFCQNGSLDLAYRFLKEMSSVGFLPSIVTYNALINGHCVLGKMEEAMGIVRDLSEKGLSPDVVTYSTLISWFCRHQELDRAFRLKLEMSEKGVFPDVITYSTLIQGLCQQRMLDEACDLFREMVSKNLPPDEFAYTTLIYAYCEEGDLNRALELHNEMVKMGLLPDVVTYSVLINGLNKQARTREAKRLLHKLFYNESDSNDIAYNNLIENCSNVDFRSVVALLKGFCMKGLMEEADWVFNTMLKRNHKPDETVYNVIVHGHCRGGDVIKAYELYKEMTDYGYAPHSEMLIALIKALSRRGMKNELSQVMSHSLRRSGLVDGELAKAVEEINNGEGNMDAVCNTLRDMADDGLLPNSPITAYSGG